MQPLSTYKHTTSINWKTLAVAAIGGLLPFAPLEASQIVWLDSMNLATMRQGWGTPQANHSVTGQPLSINGIKFERGVGTHAPGIFVVNLNGGAAQFLASVGVDDDVTGRGSVVFRVVADGRNVYDSGIMTPHVAPKNVDVNLQGAKVLVLQVTDAGDGRDFDHADWADARFVVTGSVPKPEILPEEKPYILTPSPGPAPRINGPTIYGARPGHPFLYRIPTQGERPILFSASNLPDGLELDAQTGIISGTTPPRGTYEITFHAKNNEGGDSRAFKLVSGDTLALTPSMGWNDWYAHYDHITDELMRAAADAMVRSGMADVGYQYVNIDDCWMNAAKSSDPERNGPFRDGDGNIIPNKHFPDMKALAGYIHSKGLKAGLYTSPGPRTCAGFAGSYQHESQDAREFAAWGFDFLKYDWCSYGGIAGRPLTLDKMKAPYLLMGKLLREQNRDIVFNLCQYGMGDVWKWGAEVGGNSWRTAGDLGGELDRIIDVARKNSEHRDWQKPGAWNDPDYIQIGYIGNPNAGDPEVRCPFTPSEQYAFMSLWCLMASPLFYSGDMDRLDPFTLNVLCNPEVIEVDQDPLGECAKYVKLDDSAFAMVKNMSDGSKAVGLGNRGELAADISISWEQLGISGRQRIRDLWRQKDIGAYDNKFTASVPRHGVVLARLWPSR